MKRFSRRLTAGCLLLPALATKILASPLHDETKRPVVDETFTKKIEPPPKAAPIDDYMIDLAKAADVNFIVDATQIPAGPQVTPFPAGPTAILSKWQPKLYLVLLDLTQEHKLSLLRYDDETFLFWSEPDLLSLVQLIVAEENLRTARKLPNPTEMWNLMSDYARRVHGWNEQQQPELSLDVKIADLPDELRATVLAAAHADIMGTERSLTFWISDEFWEKAKVRFQPHRTISPGPILPTLEVASPGDKTHSAIFRVIAGLDLH